MRRDFPREVDSVRVKNPSRIRHLSAADIWFTRQHAALGWKREPRVKAVFSNQLSVIRNQGGETENQSAKPLGEIEEIRPSLVIIPIQRTGVHKNHTTTAVQYECGRDACDRKAFRWLLVGKIDRDSNVILL